MGSWKFWIGMNGNYKNLFGLFVFLSFASISFGLLLRWAVEFEKASSYAYDTSFQSSFASIYLTNFFSDWNDKLKNEREKAATLIFVGDIMLSRGVDYYIRKNNDYSFPFRFVYEKLSDADLAFGNLEGPISSRGRNQGSIYSFRADPRTVEGLKLAGFDVLSLANNHIFDWGAEAISDTVSILSENEIGSVGVGRNYEEANAPFVFFLPDGTKIGFLAFTNLYPETLFAKEDSPGISRFEIDFIKEKIKNLKENSDIAVVSLHWGEEYQVKQNSEQEKLARFLVDTGADLVIGHHPHVVQEVEKYGNGWIAYSLGNFIFDQGFSEETSRGLILKVAVKSNKIEDVFAQNVRINKEFQPFFIDN